jgi:hypothetical protein
MTAILPSPHATTRSLPLQPLWPLAEEAWWLIRVVALLLWWTARFGCRLLGRIPVAAVPPLAAVGLCGFLGFKAVSGYLADTRPLASVLLVPAVAGGGFALFVAWAVLVGPRTLAASARVDNVQSRAEVAEHERRHERVLDGLGIKHRPGRVWQNWNGYWCGIVEIVRSRANMAKWHALSQAEQAAVYVAGAMGPEGEVGCSSDLYEVSVRWCFRSTAEAIARRYL